MTSTEPPIESVILLHRGDGNSSCSVEDFCASPPPDTPFWIHFSIDNTAACKWLQEKSQVDTTSVEHMLSRKVRPKGYMYPDALLLILRVADTVIADQHEELRSLRIYADGNRIISTSLYPLPVIKALTKKWSTQSNSTARIEDIFLDLVIESVRGLEGILEELDDRADALERQVLDQGDDPEDFEISTMALDALDLRRCLAPQSEVMSHVANAELPWLDDSHHRRLTGIRERVARQLGETEVLRERARIIREQHNSHVAEQVNQRLYIFSVAAVVFLPLSFLTGLLGVNLGGIPGAASPLGFIGFCSLLIGLTAGMVFVFRRFSWL